MSKWNFNDTMFEEMEIEIQFKGYHHPATMYRNNGDPGDPEEFEDERIVQSLVMFDHTFEGKELSELLKACPKLDEALTKWVDKQDMPDNDGPDPDYGRDE